MSFTHCYPVTTDTIADVSTKTGVDTTQLAYKLFFAELNEAKLFAFVRQSGEVAYKMVNVNKLEDDDFNLFRFMQTGEL